MYTRTDYTLSVHAFLISDEDGSEFERELTETLEGLSVSATANKLSRVPATHSYVDPCLVLGDKVFCETKTCSFINRMTACIKNSLMQHSVNRVAVLLIL